MKVKIKKGTARGTVSAPASKSMAHRLLIAAAMCEGESRIDGISSCEDVLATIDCLRALGANIEYNGDTVTVRGANFKEAVPSGVLNCRESGSTLRFLIPIALLSSRETVFTGAARLIERPHEIYEQLCAKKALLFEKSDSEIKVRGPLTGGDIEIPGNISSQFITGLLFALSKENIDSRIIITTKIESRSYIELTRSALDAFGVEVIWENDSTLFIKGGQTYKPQNITVEGDYSGTAFTESLNLFGGDVTVTGLRDDSLQGDRAYREYFKELDAGTPTISIENCPDLGPILFTVAAAKNGARFTDTKRLKIKESDRAAVMAEELAKFGAELIVDENSVTVTKKELHAPEKILSGHNDHRIVMSLTVLSTIYGGEIDGAEAVKKSYPDFFTDMERLGIEVEFYGA